MVVRKLFNYWISKSRSGFFSFAAFCLGAAYLVGFMMMHYEMQEMSVLLRRIAFIGFLILAVLFLIHQNLNAFYDFLNLFKDTDHLPQKQISYVNSFCMTVFLGISMIGSLILVYATEPVWQAIYDWITSRPEMSLSEPIIPETMGGGMDLEQLSKLMDAGPKAPEWFKYIWQALDIVMFVLFWVFVIFALRAMLRSIWGFIIKPRHFDEDEKIYLKPTLNMPFGGNETDSDAKKDSGLRYLVSADARIRRHYKKTILTGRKQKSQASAPPEWASPTELEQSAAVDDQTLHRLYEKARYSREECTEEEWKRLSGS